MSEEEKTPQVEQNTTQQPEVTKTQPEETKAEKSAEEIASDELEELNREIEEANKSLVSEDVARVIKLEKEAAKKEAEKEFLVNQRVKDLEAEKEALRKQMEAAERKTAEELDAFKQQINSLRTSRAPVVSENPFNAQPTEPQKPNNTGFTDTEAEEIERASLEAFLESKTRI